MHPRTTISPCHLKCCRNFVVFTNAFTGSPNQICVCRHCYPSYPLSQHFLPTSWCSLVWEVMEHCLGTVKSRAVWTVRCITHSFKTGCSGSTAPRCATRQWWNIGWPDMATRWSPTTCFRPKYPVPCPSVQWKAHCTAVRTLWRAGLGCPQPWSHYISSNMKYAFFALLRHF